MMCFNMLKNYRDKVAITKIEYYTHQTQWSSWLHEKNTAMTTALLKTNGLEFDPLLSKICSI